MIIGDVSGLAPGCPDAREFPTRPGEPERCAGGGAGGHCPVMVEVMHLRVDVAGRWHYRQALGLLRAGSNPDDTARRIAGLGELGDPDTVVHSTSWRYHPGGYLVLTYAVLPDPDPAAAATALADLEIAQGAHAGRPTPEHIAAGHVAAHALRHLALLVETDPVVAAAINADCALALGLASRARALAGRLPATGRRALTA